MMITYPRPRTPDNRRLLLQFALSLLMAANRHHALDFEGSADKLLNVRCQTDRFTTMASIIAALNGVRDFVRFGLDAQGRRY